MKTAVCILKYLRIGPRKVRLVLATIRRKPVDQALAILKHTNKKAAHLVYQAVKSAAANAKVLKMDEARLYVSEAKADGGPLMKRFMTRSMGRADRMLRRTSHITVRVAESTKVLRPKNEETVLKKEEAPKIKKQTKEKKQAEVKS
jgi:large subunit ribosomal protein L22